MGLYGKLIEQIRTERGKTQEELANFLGVDIKTIGRIERGETKSIKTEYLSEICKYFNVPISIFTDTNKMSVSQNKNVSKSGKNMSVSRENQSKNDKKIEQQAGLTDNLSDSQEKDVSKSSKDMSVSGKTDKVLNITVLSHHAAAGTSSDVYDIEVFDTHEILTISQMLFKTITNSDNLRTTKVDGYSMTPMLYPDNWVIFDITKKAFRGDGLYVLVWRDMLMVKLLQLSSKGTLKIISRNPDYESWEIDPDDQSVFKIFGKVVKIIC
ncbi:MAG: LexA family transcriptional regulator [Campylobacteraceae bacterium]|jgi:phage repressor protein C with HTH and peptisase S24 domain/DNA-binding Xre family transcriptional regulator|nr:LexA family transcriptional regulator [Campylobacteraceae bacterium]